MLISVLLFTQIACYGRIGHALSGMLAEELLTKDGKSLILTLLPNSNLADACSWADEIKSDHSWDWAKALHYINPALDKPPLKCIYRPGPEDCPNGICVTEAIQNYTRRLVQKTDIDPEAMKQSFKFMIHFVGDIHQPLHASGKLLGGTQAQVRFDRRVTNLHVVWDSLLFEV
jgi:hypothetical protein